MLKFFKGTHKTQALHGVQVSRRTRRSALAPSPAAGLVFPACRSAPVITRNEVR